MRLRDWIGRLFGRRKSRPLPATVKLPLPVRQFTPWPEGGYLVGGAVRDALLERDTSDLDWLVAQPERAASLAAGLVDGAHFALDERRGHWRLVTSSVIRDYVRLDGELEANLLERDFTINALALGPDGQVTDVTGGLDDLRAGLLRMTGERQLRNDPVRLLRGARLATELELQLDGATGTTIRALAAEQLAGTLPLPAWERSRSELDRILQSGRAARGVALLDDLGLLDVYLPELAAGRGVDQGGMHHLDVLSHQVDALAQLLHHFPDADLTLRWATLLHDLGKPATAEPDEDAPGRIRFHGHDRLGADLARTVMQRLREPSARTERVANLVRRHMQPLPTDKRSTGRFIHRYGALLPDLLKLMVADREAARGKLASEAGRKRYRVAVGRVLQELEEVPEERPQPLLSGEELMELLDLQPGPRVGQVVRYLAELQAVGDADTVEEAKVHLREYARVQWGGAEPE